MILSHCNKTRHGSSRSRWHSCKICDLACASWSSHKATINCQFSFLRWWSYSSEAREGSSWWLFFDLVEQPRYCGHLRGLVQKISNHKNGHLLVWPAILLDDQVWSKDLTLVSRDGSICTKVPAIEVCPNSNSSFQLRFCTLKRRNSRITSYFFLPRRFLINSKYILLEELYIPRLSYLNV